MSVPRLLRLPEPPPLTPATPLLTAHLPACATALAVLPGDSCVAATGHGLIVVSLSTGDVVVKDTKPVARLSLTPGGHLVTAGPFDISVWDPVRWKVIRKLKYKGRLLTDVAASDEVVVAGGWDGAWVWDIRSGRQRRTLTGGEVMAVALAPDGKQAITVERDRRTVLWDLATGEVVRPLRGPDPVVEPIDWNRPVDWKWELPLDEAYRSTAAVGPGAATVVADGQLSFGSLTGLRTVPDTSTRTVAVRQTDGLVAAAVDESIRLLNRDGDVVDVLVPTFTPVTALAFTADGRLVSSQTISNVTVWQVAADPQPGRRSAHPKAVWRTAIDTTGRYGKSMTGDGGMKLWDLRTGRDAAPVQLRWFVPDGGASMTDGSDGDPPLYSDDGTVTVEDVFDEHGGSLTKTVCCREFPGGQVRWRWTPDGLGTRWWMPDWVVLPRHGDAVLVCTDPNRVTVLDLATGERRGSFKVTNASDAWPQTLPDGSLCLRYMNYGTHAMRLMRLDWRTGTMRRIAEMPDCGNAMLTADDLVVAVGSNEIRLVDPARPDFSDRLTVTSTLQPASLSISPDGRVLLIGDDQGGIHILSLT